jgi:hypothetical protein
MGRWWQRDAPGGSAAVRVALEEEELQHDARLHAAHAVGIVTRPERVDNSAIAPRSPSPLRVRRSNGS